MIFVENKKPNKKDWQIDTWKVYKSYYRCLQLFNQKKYDESYGILRDMNDTIDDLLTIVEADERVRLEHTKQMVHRLSVEILKNLWTAKSGNAGLMVDACSEYLEYPQLAKKGGWFSWW